MGGGITIGVHCRGRVIDVNNGLHGEGPLSPERAGTIPAGDLIDMCFSGEYTKDELMKMLVGGGGLAGYLGTTDAVKVEKMIKEGDQKLRSSMKRWLIKSPKKSGGQRRLKRRSRCHYFDRRTGIWKIVYFLDQTIHRLDFGCRRLSRRK